MVEGSVFLPDTGCCNVKKVLHVATGTGSLCILCIPRAYHLISACVFNNKNRLK